MLNAGARVKHVFFEALDCESDEDRRTYLAQACADDTPLRSRVEKLLRAHQQAGDFLDGSANADPEMASLVGTELGRFKIDRLLGTGSFGTVWLARDPILKRDVAIKVAHVGVHARADLQERFEREAHLAARLHHPNIVPVFETGIDHGRMFIVSEYCQGQNLAEWLDKLGAPVDPVEAARLIRQLADAVDHAHRQGLIHRDIKPGNILLMMETTAVKSMLIPRLTDFGIARDLTSETSPTRAGLLLGTAAYMSPEQATGSVESHGPASDVFSLGVLLYRLVAGTEPFSGSSDFAIIEQIAHAEPLVPSEHVGRVGRDLSSICLKCLEKRPERRYRSAAALRDDLDRFLRNEATVARPITTAERVARWARREPSAAALVLVIVAAMAIIISGMGVYIRAVKQHTRDMSHALREARQERELARQARQLAESQRQIADAERQTARQTSYRSDIRLAFDVWQRGQVRDAVEILARQELPADRDLRGLEWFVLAADVRAKYAELGRHEGAATECVLSHDGQQVYTAGTDGLVRVWDWQTGQELASLGPNIGELHALALSPDGSTIAVGGKPWLLDLAHVVLVDVATGQRIRSLQSHKTTIESIAFSPDGKWLAAGSRYEPVQLTRLPDGHTFTIPAGKRNRAVSFSADGTLLVVTADKFGVWQLSEDEPLLVHELAGSQTEQPYLASCATKDPIVAISHLNERHISLFNFNGPILRAVAFRERNSAAAKFTCMAFGENDRLLAAGDETGTVRLWEAAFEQLGSAEKTWADAHERLDPIDVWKPHDARATSLVVTADSTIVSSGEDGTVVRFSPFASGATALKWKGIHVNDTVLDGNELLLACEDGTIRRYSLGSETRRQKVIPATKLDGRLQGIEPETRLAIVFAGSSPLQSLAASADGQWIATGTVGGGLHLHERDTGRFVRTLASEHAIPSEVAVRDIAFASHGQLLAYTDERELVVVVDSTNGDVVLSRPLGSRGYAVEFLGEDRLVAVGGQFEGVRTFDVASGKLLGTVGDNNTHALDAGRQGRWLASIHADGTVEILDGKSGTRLRQIAGHIGVGESSAFSKTDRTLISLDDRCTIRLTDVATGLVFGSLQLPDRPADVKFAHVHCNEQFMVVVAGDDATLHLYLWDLQSVGSPAKTHD